MPRIAHSALRKHNFEHQRNEALLPLCRNAVYMNISDITTEMDDVIISAIPVARVVYKKNSTVTKECCRYY